MLYNYKALTVRVADERMLEVFDSYCTVAFNSFGKVFAYQLWNGSSSKADPTGLVTFRDDLRANGSEAYC